MFANSLMALPFVCVWAERGPPYRPRGSPVGGEANTPRWACNAGEPRSGPTIPGGTYMRGAGRVVFAATLLLIAGTLNIIYGIGSLDDANIFTNDKRYIFTNLNTLGWVLI